LGEKDGQTYAVVSFKDNGHGISEETQEKIFELNYTTKREGNFGLGIGLSVESKLGEYTNMRVWLPLLLASTD